jgi:hypothetical protein
VKPIQIVLLAAIVIVSVATIAARPEPEVIRTIALTPRPIPKPVVVVEVDVGEARRVIKLTLSPRMRLAAARLAMNEDSRALRGVEDGGTDGELTADTLGILQVVHDFAAWTGKSHGESLRLLGPHVAGGKQASRRRHAVYRTLPANGLDRPPLWEDEIDGPWEAYAENWGRVRKAVDKACSDGFVAPFAVHVVAWGNDADAVIAARRKLVLVTNGPQTINDFYARAVIAARIARGRS